MSTSEPASRSDIFISMFSNSYGSYAEDALGDMMWIAAVCGGHMAVCGEDYFACSRKPFTKEEAEAALKDWYKSMELDYEPEPTLDQWVLGITVYRVVEGTDKNAKEYIVHELSDLDMDWNSIEEYDTARALHVGDNGWTSKDEYLHVNRIPVWEDDKRLKEYYDGRPAKS